MKITEIKFTGDMARLDPKPGDIYVLTVQQSLNTTQAAMLRQQLSAALNGAKVLVLTDGATLTVSSKPCVF